MASPTRIRDLRRALADQQPAQALSILQRLHRQGLPAALLRPVLSECHPGLDRPYLDLDLVPAPVLLLALLKDPPPDCPLDAARIELSHGCDLATFAQHHLNRVLRGETSLYAGLPPVEIRHYRSLAEVHPHRRALIRERSALECLALEPDPTDAGPSSPLERWAASRLDALLHLPLVLLEGPGQNHASLSVARLGADACMQVSDLASAAALGRDAAVRLLRGGAHYLLWNRQEPLPVGWAGLLRGLAQDGEPPFQQLRQSASGTEVLLSPVLSAEPALLLISARWLARRQPQQIQAFVRHWLASAVPPPSAGVRIPSIKGLLLLAATARQVADLGLDVLCQRARARAIDGGFDQGAVLQLGGAEAGCVAEQIRCLCLAHESARVVISLIGPDDRPVQGAWRQLQSQFLSSLDAVVCTDEELIWSSSPDRTGLRQFAGCITPWRVLVRGHVPGLLSFSARSVVGLGLQPDYLSLHALARDLALLWLARFSHIHLQPEVLLHRDPRSHPAVAAITPGDASQLSQEQGSEVDLLLNKHASSWLSPDGHFGQAAPNGTVFVHRSNSELDLISVIIPYRDKAELTRTCVLSLLRQDLPVRLEIVLVDNGSCDPDAIALAAELAPHANEVGVSLVAVRDDSPFNYASLNNRARTYCSGNFLLLLNNDIRFDGTGSLQALLDPFGLASTGAVGARLLYEDGTIQHHGLVAAARQPYDILSPAKGLIPGPSTAPYRVLEVQEQWSAATAACLLIRTALFDRLGGFDESFAVAYNDVDFCWRLNALGYSVVVTPETEIVHSESKSRGEDIAGAKRNRLAYESGILRSRYPDYFQTGDPFYHRFLNQSSHRFEPMPPPAAPLCQATNQLIFTWTHPRFRAHTVRPILIYVHWSPQASVRPDVIKQLDEYRQYADIVFVSASEGLASSPQQINGLQRSVDVILIRRNNGYDFASWKAGLDFCREAVQQAPWVILANDSCYGPLQPLSRLFNQLQSSRSDVVGLTASTSIRNHLQSYFIAYRWNVVRTPLFNAFWNSIGVWDSKVDLVMAHEICWSGVLEDIGFSLEALYMSGEHGNVTHTHWRQLLSQGFPFIKSELLRINPILQDIDGWFALAAQMNPTTAEMIVNHLELTAPVHRPGKHRKSAQLNRDRSMA